MAVPQGLKFIVQPGFCDAKLISDSKTAIQAINSKDRYLDLIVFLLTTLRSGWVYIGTYLALLLIESS